MRKFHRWFGFPAALFMLFVAITGVAMQADFWLTGRSPPGSEPQLPAPKLALPGDAELRDMVVKAADASRRLAPGISAERLELRFTGDKPVATVGAAMPFGPNVQIDLGTGKQIPPPEGEKGYHAILQDLHAGYRFGPAGRIVSVLLGLTLIGLSITGLTVYIDMFRRRRKAGKRNPFWH